MSVLWVLAGTVVGLVALLDVWLTILHPDAEGFMAAAVRRGVWALAARRGPRLPLVLAGPVLVTVTFAAWLASLTLGVALIVRPGIDEYRTPDGVSVTGFAGAVYYAGTTLSVLGYGDITPAGTGSRIFAVVVAGLGFALFTASITYLIQVTSGLRVRNRFALTVHDQFRGTDGAGLVLRSITEEGVDAARQRCMSWADQLRGVEDTIRRYPLVALTYRPRRPDYDLEPALQRLAEAAVAALLCAHHPRTRALRPRAEELASALLRMQDTIACRYLDLRSAEGAAAGPGDDEELRRLWCRVRPGIGAPEGDEPPADDLAGQVQRRSLAFFEALRGWSAPRVDISTPRTGTEPGLGRPRP
jgi:hypothetical protein